MRLRQDFAIRDLNRRAQSRAMESHLGTSEEARRIRLIRLCASMNFEPRLFSIFRVLFLPVPYNSVRSATKPMNVICEFEQRDCREIFHPVGRRVAEGFQEAVSHENRNIVFVEAEHFSSPGGIHSCWIVVWNDFFTHGRNGWSGKFPERTGRRGSARYPPTVDRQFHWISRNARASNLRTNSTFERINQ